ncbi:hypothetical protein N7474_008090 [Penicillium riverlandense]|uniref:uncharacterized protein n=1 Tax=Penicillium riverlandense TaxID=1903569 RepID=UPI002546B550|nr:uncharacterized protein N7474_008090 [Penicillium riverlandense]KAJ5811789.1 hypothetical protein N7474_008090 [Penicillium riverlandense]
MRYTTAISVLVAASASLALADDSSKCAAQKVVDQCVTDMKFQLENCDTGDWDCMCTHSTDVVGCYNNCPEDEERLGAQQIRQQNCANARAYSGKTTETGRTGASATAVESMSRMASSSAAHSTSTGLISSSDESTANTEQSDSSSDEKPSKSLTGLSATSSPSQGVAVSNRVAETGMWLAFLGMGLGVAL